MEELKISGNSLQIIDGIDVITHLEDFDDCNRIQVEVGTTGMQGGDTGHGGRTYFRIEDLASTDMRCRVRANGEAYDFSQVCGTSQIEIIFGGDSELVTFIEALELAADTLRKQAEYGDTKADIMTQLQKASKTVLEISAKNKELIKDNDALQVEVQASKANAEEYHRLMREMDNVAEEAQNISKSAIEEIRELKDYLYDDVTKIAGLRSKVVLWKGACLLFASISALALIFTFIH